MADYDIIIVGAGSAGCPLAARLSEDPALRVVLVEAGPFYTTLDDFPDELKDANSALACMPGHPNNWSFMAEVTAKVSFPLIRGKVVGGSSALNGTMFMRGVAADFDEWHRLGNTEWSHEKVLPHFIRLEADQDCGGPLHGSNGPIPVRRPTQDELGMDQSAFVAACEECGFTRLEDKNVEQGDGVGPIPLNSIDNLRMNAALGYILPNLGRTNLSVLGKALVRRVLFDGKNAVGIEVEIEGSVREISGDEIILSAGAIKSPHILMLSGIGPAKDLEAHGIKVVSAIDAVGKNLTDHPATVVGYRTKRAIAVDPRAPQMQVMLDCTASGSSCETDLAIIPLCRNPMAEAFAPSTASTGPFGFLPLFLRHPLRAIRTIRGASVRALLQQFRQRKDRLITCIMNQAAARGELRLVSADPQVAPAVRYHNFANAEDLRRMREALRLTARLLQSRAFKKLGAEVVSPPAITLASDAELDAWIVANSMTAFHTASSCRMGPADDPHAVVDQYCRVRGVSGLRVVDCSIMPFVPRRGVAASAIMVGERAADLIKATLHLKT